MEGRNKLVYPELSYDIVGSAFTVFNTLGYGHRESYYQKALSLELKKRNINYEREKEIALKYENCQIGKYRLDFLVEDKIIVELKVLSSYRYRSLRQILEYLKAADKKLAILIYFTKNGVYYRRSVNPIYRGN